MVARGDLRQLLATGAPAGRGQPPAESSARWQRCPARPHATHGRLPLGRPMRHEPRAVCRLEGLGFTLSRPTTRSSAGCAASPSTVTRRHRRAGHGEGGGPRSAPCPPRPDQDPAADNHLITVIVTDPEGQLARRTPRRPRSLTGSHRSDRHAARKAPISRVSCSGWSSVKGPESSMISSWACGGGRASLSAWSTGRSSAAPRQSTRGGRSRAGRWPLPGCSATVTTRRSRARSWQVPACSRSGLV